MSVDKKVKTRDVFPAEHGPSRHLHFPHCLFPVFNLLAIFIHFPPNFLCFGLSFVFMEHQPFPQFRIGLGVYEYGVAMKITEGLADVLSFANIVISFFVDYKQTPRNSVTKPEPTSTRTIQAKGFFSSTRWRIVRHYVATWFLFDILPFVPWYLIDSTWWVLLFRLVRFRFISKFKFIVRFIVFKIINRAYHRPKFVRMVTMTISILYECFILLAICHFCTCATQFFSIKSQEDDEESYYQSFLDDLFYVVSTISNVGNLKTYIDLNITEVLYSCALQLLGNIIFSLVLARFRSVIRVSRKIVVHSWTSVNFSLENPHQFTAFFSFYLSFLVSFGVFPDESQRGLVDFRGKQKEKLEVWIKNLDSQTFKGLDQAFIGKIKSLFYFQWNNNFRGLFSKSDAYFHSMDRQLKFEVQEKLFSRLIHQFPLFFRKIDQTTAFQLIFFLEPRVFLNGDTILDEANFSDGVYFIASGSVVMYTFNYMAYRELILEAKPYPFLILEPPSLQFSKGSFFGEDFFLGKPNICRVECSSEKVQTLFLCKKTLENLTNGLQSKKMQFLNLLSFKRRTFFALVHSDLARNSISVGFGFPSRIGKEKRERGPRQKLPPHSATQTRQLLHTSHKSKKTSQNQKDFDSGA